MKDNAQRHVTGKGAFVADLVLPDMLHLKVVRSLYGRARLLRVAGGVTNADFAGTMSSVGEGAEGGQGAVVYPVLAKDRVNFAGQPVAGVLGRTEAEAEDLMASVDVEYEPLPAVVDPEAALAAEPIHPGTASNVIREATAGKDFKDPKSPIVVAETLRNERVVPNPMEPRGAVASWDGARLTVYASTQSAHSWKEGFSESFHLPPESVRVVQMDTGGAFGSKGGIYPEYVLAAWLSMRERRPVKWVETRSEHLQATNQGRGARARVTLFADRRGRVQGMKGDLLIDSGAYSVGVGGWAPRWIGLQMTGAYAIPKAYIAGRSVYTNKVPLGPYRGAGRPEAAFFIERMMDFLADEVGLDPAAVRLRNMRSTRWASPTGMEIPAAAPFFRAALRNLGYRAAARRRNTGLSCFVLIPAARDGEGARIAVRGGRVNVWLGGNAHGQDHEAFVRSLAARELGVPRDAIDLERGDTDALSEGVGTWGSRTAIVGGGAVVKAARTLKARVRRRHGRYSADKLLAGSFDARAFFAPKENMNSLGANLVIADVEETGLARVREVRSYYDAGEVLNPAALESQVAGGSAQGIGQVLYEGAVYDADGNVLAASLADAGVPTAVEMPRFVIKTARTRSGLPHGAKGVGESPTIGVPPALVRSLERQVGRRLTKTPLAPEDLLGVR